MAGVSAVSRLPSAVRSLEWNEQIYDKGNGTELIWFDAHANFETPETLMSGYLDSMAGSLLMGECWRSLLQSVPGYRKGRRDDLVLVGTRDVSESEKQKLAIEQVRMVAGRRDLSGEAAAEELESALRQGGRRQEQCVVHIDLDCLDTSIGTANEFAVPGGLLEQDLSGCLDVVMRTRCPNVLSVAGFNPSCEGAAQAAEVAVKAIAKVVKAVCCQFVLQQFD